MAAEPDHRSDLDWAPSSMTPPPLDADQAAWLYEPAAAATPPDDTDPPDQPHGDVTNSSLS
jgi:hypothetical protein